MKRSALIVILVCLRAASAGATTAGPDAFGYTLADDAETGVTYAWVDMSGGTDITSSMDDDDQSTAISLGFDFTFYGTTYTSVYILSNGVLVFVPLLSSSYSPFYGTQCPLPKDDEVDGMVAFYQRDFNPADSACGTSCWIRWTSGGTSPSRWWGVTFNDMVIFRGTGSTAPPDPVTVQVVLYETSNEIRVQVLEAGLDEGEDAMIGVEALAGVSGLNLPGCMTRGYTHDLQAVHLTPPSGGTPVVPPRSVDWDLPGRTATHDFIVYNLESGAAVFDITPSGGTWTTTPSVTTLSVASGSTGTFSVDVAIDSTTTGGEADVSTITLHPTSGGAGDVTAETVTLVQDPPSSWDNVTSMPIRVERPATATLGDDIYLVSGLQYDALAVTRYAQDSLQVLDTVSLTWNHSGSGGTLTPLTFSLGDAAACGMNGRIYVTGGLTTTTTPTISRQVHVYDPSTDTWTLGTDMPEERFRHVMVCDAARDTFHVIGGYGPYVSGVAYPQDNMWAHDAATGTWDTSIAQLPGTRGNHGAELIDPDTILVAGGSFDEIYSKRTDLYDIATDTWTRTGDLVWERFHAASGVLPTGRMCLSAGSSFALWPTTLLEDTYECYSSGYWIPQMALMNAARTRVAGATVGSQIYAIGGVDTDTLAWPPSRYTQLTLVERYPRTTAPDGSTDPVPDPVVDPVDDPVDDGPDDVPADVPDDPTEDPTFDPTDDPTADPAEDAEEDAVDDALEDTPADIPTDGSADVPTDDSPDTGGPDSEPSSGCGCSFVE
ncbi:MAG: hypothetical protein JRG91_10605 [Deltaproteobacteria bacterium]|nr:hypothetical protein [Deltaproteobacteria bacterium]